MRCFVADAEAVASLAGSPVGLVRRAIEDLGRGEDWRRVFLHKPPLPPASPAHPLWERAAALECLFRVIAGEMPAEEIPPDWTDVPAFDVTGPSLGTLARHPGAVVAFPLIDPDPPIRPQIALLWLFRLPEKSGVPDHRQFLQRSDGGELKPGEAIFFSTVTAMSIGSIADKSWQLPLAIARHAIDASPLLRAEIGRSWLATGTVGAMANVGRVDLDAKLRLKTQRNWLLPAPNRRDIPDSFEPQGRVALVESVEDAIGAIEGVGASRGADETLPTAVGEIWTYVSEKQKPAIQLPLLVRAGRIIVCHSHHQKLGIRAAVQFKEILGRLGVNSPIEMVQIPSEDLIGAEEVLFRQSKEPVQGNRVLFNITNGNRLMGFAAHTLARRDSRFWLLYRDWDAPPRQFTAIRYGRDIRPEVLRAEGADPPGHIDSTRLFSKDPLPEQIDEIVAHLTRGQENDRKSANAGSSGH